jgi:uncharacterized protein YaaQ
MKLVMTIVSNSDTQNILDAVAKNGYYATKVSTTGQFLVDGHSAILIGCDDEKVEELHQILKDNVTKRVVKTPGVKSTISGSLLNQAVDVEEYGAVAFTINVDDFRKF